MVDNLGAVPDQVAFLVVLSVGSDNDVECKYAQCDV